jgi:ABC-2 type transport system permease protein
MVAQAANALGIYRRLLDVQLRSQMQYRASFWFEFVATAGITAAEFGSLALVFGTFTSVGGWPLREVALLYGMVECGFGAMDLVFSGFDPATFGMQVRRGAFDQILLRPVGVTVQILGSQFVMRRLGRVAQGLVILGAAIAVNDIAWTPGRLAMLPVVFASLVAFFGGLFMAGAAITFWTVESIEVVNVFTYGGNTMISYPMSIYPTWMRRFFTYVVPAIFLNYYPTLYLLGKPDPFGLPAGAHLLAPMAGFGVLAAGYGAWRYGVRHYQSTGT